MLCYQYVVKRVNNHINRSTKSHLVMTSICQQSIKVQCTLHGYITWQKKKKRKETRHKNSKGRVEIHAGHPPRSPSFSLAIPLFLPPSICSAPLLFLSIVSTKNPIQAPMTSLTAGSGMGLTNNGPGGNKSQFIRLESDGGTG